MFKLILPTPLLLGGSFLRALYNPAPNHCSPKATKFRNSIKLGLGALGGFSAQQERGEGLDDRVEAFLRCLV